MLNILRLVRHDKSPNDLRERQGLPLACIDKSNQAQGSRVCSSTPPAPASLGHQSSNGGSRALSLKAQPPYGLPIAVQPPRPLQGTANPVVIRSNGSTGALKLDLPVIECSPPAGVGLYISPQPAPATSVRASFRSSRRSSPRSPCSGSPRALISCSPRARVPPITPPSITARLRANESACLAARNLNDGKLHYPHDVGSDSQSVADRVRLYESPESAESHVGSSHWSSKRYKNAKGSATRVYQL